MCRRFPMKDVRITQKAFKSLSHMKEIKHYSLGTWNRRHSKGINLFHLIQKRFIFCQLIPMAFFGFLGDNIKVRYKSGDKGSQQNLLGGKAE